jgi:hypothetical protein
VISGWEGLQRTAVTSLGDGFGVRASDSEALDGLTEAQATIALGLAAGFSMTQIIEVTGIKQTQYRKDFKLVKDSLLRLRNTTEMRNGRPLESE